MKSIIGICACILLLFPIYAFSQDEPIPLSSEEKSAADDKQNSGRMPGIIMLGLYGSLGFTISGEKNMPSTFDLKPSPALGYSAGGSVGIRIINEFSPMFHCEFSGKNHKYHNYNFFIEQEYMHWKTYFVSIMGGLRYWMNEIYLEPGAYIGFPVLDWGYRYVDKSRVPEVDTKRTPAEERKQKDIGIYLLIGSLIPLRENLYADAGLQIHFGITRTLNDKSVSTDTESANRLYLALRMGIMARL